LFALQSDCLEPFCYFAEDAETLQTHSFFAPPLSLSSSVSWQHVSFPLSVPPLEPSDWPECQSFSVWARPQPAVCSAVVEEGQLLSAAEEGTEKTLQCVSPWQWQWPVPKSPSNSLCVPLRVKHGSWGPDSGGGGGSLSGVVSRSAQPHAKPNGPWRTFTAQPSHPHYQCWTPHPPSTIFSKGAKSSLAVLCVRPYHRKLEGLHYAQRKRAGVRSPSSWMELPSSNTRVRQRCLIPTPPPPQTCPPPSLGTHQLTPIRHRACSI
ncbi:3-methyl-2-oxobutanoate hydroxymethyltransferase, partial [Dissostichus eleginoides]